MPEISLGIRDILPGLAGNLAITADNLIPILCKLLPLPVNGEVLGVDFMKRILIKNLV